MPAGTTQHQHRAGGGTTGSSPGVVYWCLGLQQIREPTVLLVLLSLDAKIAYMNNFVVQAQKLNQLPFGHAQTRRRRRRETVTRMSTARTRRCTENSQIPGKRKPNGTGRGFLQGHTRGAITPAPFVQTTSGCRATVPRTPRPGRPPPPFSAGPTSAFALWPLAGEVEFAVGRVSGEVAGRGG